MELRKASLAFAKAKQLLDRNVSANYNRLRYIFLLRLKMIPPSAVGKFPAMSASSLRFAAFLTALTACCPLAWCQTKPAVSTSQAIVPVLVEDRAKRLMPLSVPPAVDWDRIKNAFAFQDAHSKSISNTLITTSLVSTYACRDIEPVLVYTGKLINDYNKRMQKTGEWINQMLAEPKSKNEFLKKNYKSAVDLGLMHLDVSQTVPVKDLKWDGKVRVPINEQAYAFVLYSFAWQPIEVMEATHEIDPVKDQKGISDWLYLWNVLGYGMGEDQRLLPQSVDQTTTLVQILRNSQYFHQSETPKEVQTLLWNEMTFLYAQAGNGLPIDDPTKLSIRQMLEQQITFSPGLSVALGLGPNAAIGLEQMASDGPP